MKIGTKHPVRMFFQRMVDVVMPNPMRLLVHLVPPFWQQMVRLKVGEPVKILVSMGDSESATCRVRQNVDLSGDVSHRDQNVVVHLHIGEYM